MNTKKRRIYDITNVLEGIGFIKKNSKRNEIEIMPEFFQQIVKQIEELEIKKRSLADLINKCEKISLKERDFYVPEPWDMININEEIDDDARYFIKK